MGNVNVMVGVAHVDTPSLKLTPLLVPDEVWRPQLGLPGAPGVPESGCLAEF